MWGLISLATNLRTVSAICSCSGVNIIKTSQLNKKENLDCRAGRHCEPPESGRYRTRILNHFRCRTGFCRADFSLPWRRRVDFSRPWRTEVRPTRRRPARINSALHNVENTLFMEKSEATWQSPKLTLVRLQFSFPLHACHAKSIGVQSATLRFFRQGQTQA